MAVAEEAPEHHMEEEAEVASTVAGEEALEAEAELEVEVVAEVVDVDLVTEAAEDAVAPEVAEAALAQAPRCSCKPMKDLKASIFYVERTMPSLHRTRLRENQFTTKSESAQR